MKHYRPYTKWRRHLSTVTFRGVLTASEPHKALTTGGKRFMGRNSGGRITVRHKGGGHKRLFRDVDFGYKKQVPARVETIEYDPNRSGFIGVLVYRDGDRRYALLPKSVKLAISLLPPRTRPATPGQLACRSKMFLSAVSLQCRAQTGQGGKLGRVAGVPTSRSLRATRAMLILKMPSSEVRKVLENCWATIGEVFKRRTSFGDHRQSR